MCLAKTHRKNRNKKGAVKKVNNLHRGMQKNSAERTKTAEQHSCEGYPVVYVGTRGTVFVRSLTAFNTRKSANLQIFSEIINLVMLFSN